MGHKSKKDIQVEEEPELPHDVVVFKRCYIAANIMYAVAFMAYMLSTIIFGFDIVSSLVKGETLSYAFLAMLFIWLGPVIYGVCFAVQVVALIIVNVSNPVKKFTGLRFLIGALVTAVTFAVILLIIKFA